MSSSARSPAGQARQTTSQTMEERAGGRRHCLVIRTVRNVPLSIGVEREYSSPRGSPFPSFDDRRAVELRSRVRRYTARMLLGAHVAVAGGLHHAPERGCEIGADVIQVFTRNPAHGARDAAPAVWRKEIAWLRRLGG